MEKKSFEEKLKELENIVSKLESENLSLELSVDLYQKAKILSQELNNELNASMEKLSFIVEDDEVKPYFDEEAKKDI